MQLTRVAGLLISSLFYARSRNNCGMCAKEHRRPPSLFLLLLIARKDLLIKGGPCSRMGVTAHGDPSRPLQFDCLEVALGRSRWTEKEITMSTKRVKQDLSQVGQGQDQKSRQPAGQRRGQKTEVGGPGPHGSSDPATADKNKNKPLLAEWGKGDKH
jgi:hypothetical protein